MQTRAKHAARSEKCSVGGRQVLHATKRARAARHETKVRRQRRFEAAAADKARCLRRGASANGVGWSAPRVGRTDNRAKHAARRDKCSVGGRRVLHRTKHARAARHETKTRRQRRFEAAATDKARCLRRGASANGVGWSAPRVGRTDNRAKHAVRSEKCSVGGRRVSTGRSECTSGHPAQVAYSDPARAIGVAMRRAWARAWVVWCDTTERQPRTCDWDRAVACYLAFNGRRSGARLAPAVLAPSRRRGTDRGRLYFSETTGISHD